MSAFQSGGDATGRRAFKTGLACRRVVGGADVALADLENRLENNAAVLVTVLRSQRLQSMIKDAGAVQGLLLRLEWNDAAANAAANSSGAL